MTKISEIYGVLTSAESEETNTFEDVKRVFQKWLCLSDSSVLDIIFGTYVAHQLPGERVWLLIVAASGGVKTEIIRSLELVPDTFSLSSLSGRSLLSGTRIEGEKDPSLLPKLDGKVLLIKDFTCVLTLSAKERREILGTLRDVYDGYTSKAFGNVGVVSVHSCFGLIAGVTPVIDKYSDVEAELGERYLKLRIEHADPMEAIRKALDNSSREVVMRSEISVAVGKLFVQNFSNQRLPNVSITPDIRERLITLAHVTATIRSRVPRHWKSEAIEYEPRPEIGTRLVKQLSQLAKGIALVRDEFSVSSEVFELVRRVASDSVPALRRKVLDALSQFSEFDSTEEIAKKVGLPTKSAKFVLDDLVILGVVEKEIGCGGRGQPHVWQLSPQFRRLVVEVF